MSIHDKGMIRGKAYLCKPAPASLCLFAILDLESLPWSNEELQQGM